MFRQMAVGQQPIIIGNNIVLAVLGIANGRVRIGVDAPVTVRVIAKGDGGGACGEFNPASPLPALRDPG